MWITVILILKRIDVKSLSNGTIKSQDKTRPQFHYKYGVSDPLTGDQKTHTETRDGDVVKGQG